MGNTENFELCETSSKIQCPDCALHCEAGIVPLHMQQMHAAYRKESTVEQGKIRRPIPGYVIEKNPTHGARHGPSVRQCMYYKAHDMLKKARKHKSGCYKTILERWRDDDKYRKSLSDIGWTEEQIIPYVAIALEDHFYVATRQERSRNGKSWNIFFECRRYSTTTESAL